MSFANINGQEIYYKDSGGNGPAIVFMHGFLFDQSLFDTQVDVLSPQYRCIRWDARGFGQTKWDGKAFDLYDSVKDCLGLMDFLSIESAVLVGMSQGGYCALRAALKEPKRVKGLVLMSTQSSINPEPVQAGFREMRDTWQQVGPVAPLLEGLATALLGPAQEPGMDQHWNKWLPQWKKVSDNAIYHAMNNLLDRDEITHLVEKITCPAFITHGNDDHAVPVSHSEQLSKLLPNCRGFVISPGSHSVNMTHAKHINPPLKKFLEEIHN